MSVADSSQLERNKFCSLKVRHNVTCLQVAWLKEPITKVFIVQQPKPSDCFAGVLTSKHRSFTNWLEAKCYSGKKQTLKSSHICIQSSPPAISQTEENKVKTQMSQLLHLDDPVHPTVGRSAPHSGSDAGRDEGRRTTRGRKSHTASCHRHRTAELHPYSRCEPGQKISPQRFRELRSSWP